MNTLDLLALAKAIDSNETPGQPVEVEPVEELQPEEVAPAIFEPSEVEFSSVESSQPDDNEPVQSVGYNSAEYEVYRDQVDRLIEKLQIRPGDLMIAAIDCLYQKHFPVN